jgi:4-aminobutyrate aminotransferase/(S)-3-amino-2-methylpropionate transaminase
MNSAAAATADKPTTLSLFMIKFPPFGTEDSTKRGEVIPPRTGRFRGPPPQFDSRYDRPMATPALRRNVVTDVPGPRAKELIARGAFDMQSIYRSVIVDDAKSQGPWLVDVDGNVFLDMFASFALGALGFNHPNLVEVARSEAFVQASINATSTPFVTAPSWIEYTEELQKKWSPVGMSKVYFVDAGGEGVESAIKAAFIVHGERRRVAAGKPKNPLELPAAEQDAIMNNAGTDSVVVSFGGAFHGRGLGPMTATHSKLIHKADLPAFPWPQVPFPANRFPLEKHADENARAEKASLQELERVLDAHAGRVAAVMVEPIQSEGGDRHASPAFFQGVQRLATKAGAALLLDEVQTGCGPTGKLWGHEHLALASPPDLVAFGKKMQMGGFFAAPDYVITQFGRMYHTRNGDRARAMISRAVLRTIESEKLLDNVRDTGAYFLARLEELAGKYPSIVSEPRGKGFLLAFDMPTTAARDDFLVRARKRGVMGTYTGTRSVRLRPHLVTRKPEVDEAIGVFAETLAEMAR